MMKDQAYEAAKSERVVDAVAVVVEDTECGRNEETPQTQSQTQQNPDKKTCYSSISTHVGDFFAEDPENPVATEESVDEDGNVIQKEKTLFNMTPTKLGAAVFGFTAASIIIGPFLAIGAGAGAAYATSRDDKAGEYSKYFGKKTYNGMSRAHKIMKRTFGGREASASTEGIDGVVQQEVA